ncbi:uncharacterized protein LOC129583102 [Paramacrobiotus metropolitanus]|uniref:uncharacterized protein LOC129583102 n=1 Tax=Paramacrobiotus metropolitanus TaxID=2943436 RepID=UPI0024456A2D|nr:uncharacterized protein LOC129583102 [Paramacrobiotus metropolitanus]
MYTAGVVYVVFVGYAFTGLVAAQQNSVGQAGAVAPAIAVFNQLGPLDALANSRHFTVNDPLADQNKKMLVQAVLNQTTSAKTPEQKANDTITDVKKMSERKPPSCTNAICSARKPCEAPCTCSAGSALTNGRCSGSTLTLPPPTK